MEYLLLVAGSIICAVLAIRAVQLRTAALWLAGVSVFTALMLYLLGAREVAVIELSVGAGLVTVLFVFAISVAGDDAMHSRPVIPRSLAWLLIVVAVLLLGLMVLPAGDSQTKASETSFAATFWGERVLDLLVQIALIFAGVLGVLGLLSESKAHISSTITPSILEDLKTGEEALDDDTQVSPHSVLEEELV